MREAGEVLPGWQPPYGEAACMELAHDALSLSHPTPQAHGMELARTLENVSKNFDSLLKVMDALFQASKDRHFPVLACEVRLA